MLYNKINSAIKISQLHTSVSKSVWYQERSGPAAVEAIWLFREIFQSPVLHEHRMGEGLPNLSLTFKQTKACVYHIPCPI